MARGVAPGPDATRKGKSLADPVAIQIPVAAFQPHRWMLESLADTTHRFKVHRWHRRARKTTKGLNKLIHAACATKDETYAYIAPTYKQAKSIIVRDPMMLRRYLPREVLRKDFNESDLTAEFVTGSVLRIFGADDPDSLRGIRFKGVVLDEWALQKRSIFDEILYPVLSESRGWADFDFTPKGRNHAYEFWRRGAMPTEYPDWRSFDLLASQSGLLSQEQLDEARRTMGESLFQQEMECAFLDDAQAVFAGLDLCIGGELQNPILGRRYVLGVDLGRHHDATVITVLDVTTRRVVAWQRLTENHWALQKLAIAALTTRYNNALIVIDATGVGDPITEDLAAQEFNVLPFKFSANKSSNTKKGLVDALRVAIGQRLLTIPKELTLLIDELRDFQVSVTPAGVVQYSCPEGEGYFDDAVISLALAVHGLQGELYVPRTDDAQILIDTSAYEVPANHGMVFAGAA